MALQGNTARFAQLPRTFDAILTAAVQNAATDVPTNVELLVTAGQQGALVTRLGAMLRATMGTDSALVLYVSRNQGARIRPKASVTLKAQTVGVTSALVEVDFPKFSDSRPLRLGPGEQLYIGSLGTPPAGGIAVHGDIQDFIE